MSGEREFAQAVFDSLQPVVDALVDDARLAFGPEFDRKDVRWLEATPDGSNQQMCRLLWRDVEMLRLQLSIPQARMEVLVSWPRSRH